MERLNKAKQTLTKLKPKKDEGLESFRERAEKIIKKYSVSGLIEIDIKETVCHQKHYTKRGRPTSKTPYKRIERRHTRLYVDVNKEVLEENQALAGWRIYVTNTQNETMTLELR